FEPNQDVIVIAATNRPDVLDPALLRPGRFDRQVALDLPDRKAREAILGIHLRGIPAAPEIDAAKIAQVTPGFAGADLANLVNEAALNAVARRASQVEPADIDAALDKIVLGNRRGTLISDAEKRLLAYHEAGHALVAAMTDGADPLRKISIVPRGQALGVTVQAPVEDRVTWTSRHLAGRLAILMGGRVAERLIFDDVSTGAQNDLKEATSLARRMVGLWGMSDDLGPYFIGLGEEHVFLGREITRAGGDVSDDLLQRAEASTQRLLTDAEATAAGILARERDALDRLAERLIAEETIDAADIAATIAGSTSDTPLPVAALSAI
ncbi:MAG TPA: AAA family ATPase, partial [Thermomicrobiales bacterium]|nr:AAA family ATPase [Thermomicrobiales bacterium]